MQHQQRALKLDFELGVIWLNEKLLVIEVFVPAGWLLSEHGWMYGVHVAKQHAC
jgi:hypothetical protein